MKPAKQVLQKRLLRIGAFIAASCKNSQTRDDLDALFLDGDYSRSAKNKEMAAAPLDNHSMLTIYS